jgi:cysteinyl-tRNA synthetase
MIRFFNTLSGKKEVFSPIVPGEVKLYTCGPTVYQYAHIGNFRAYVFEDLLKKFLVFAGYKVTQVMNITDVDDKTIRGAGAQGVSLDAYTKTYIDAFFEDIKTLNISPADHYPRATQHIPEMISLIKGLIQKGYAYEKDGSYYFSIAKFPAYGRLSKINLDELQPGQREEADEYEKESLHDFALWKRNKPGEPFWETDIGPGRPGWHIECSAMSAKYLGESFDIHCGGVDNIFPHHENEIAQSEAFSGKKFVTYWLHCHHLVVNGEKMSKSKGNFFTLRDLLARNINPLALRFLLLSTHYRKTLNFTFEALDQAAASLLRINEFAGELKSSRFPEGQTQAVGKAITEAEKKFMAGLSDDLNISVSLTALFSLIKQMNILISQGKIKNKDAEKLTAFIDSANTVLGVITPTLKIHVAEDIKLAAEIKETAQVQAQLQVLPAETLEKIKAREKARAEKNFRLADQIRKELEGQGILLEDTKDGVRWKILTSKKQTE